MVKRFQIFTLVAVLVAAPLRALADSTVSLNKDFVEKFQDRATVSTTFEVHKFHDAPNKIGTGSEDGDIHIAGIDDVVKLPMVAEIINGKREDDTLQFLLGLKQKTKVPLVGVWRLWFEHPAKDEEQVQGKRVPDPKDTNPKHVFEFHPITQFGSFDCRDSFMTIADESNEFRGYTAEKAFADYEDRPGTITKTKKGIMITSTKAQFNYVEFKMKLTGNPRPVSDGHIVLANVFNANTSDEDDPLTARPRRMIFVAGSPPDDKIAKMKKGGSLHVLGIPRVNLNEVLAIANAMSGHDEYAFGGLPYEIIIVAVFED